jgi:periplasmic protein TonB
MTAFASYSPQGLSGRPRWGALGMAAAIEGAIVVAVLAGAARHVRHDEPVVLSVDLMTPTAPPVTPTPIVKPDVSPPRAKSPPLPAVQLPVVPEPAPAPPPSVASPLAQPVVRNVEAVAAAVAPPPPPAASAAPSAEYIAKVRAAVQGAFEYPMAAKAQDFKGRARVAFSLDDTRPSGARIVVSSGMGVVDRAALKAVEGATYPPAPEALSHAAQAFEVWVSFGA